MYCNLQVQQRGEEYHHLYLEVFEYLKKNKHGCDTEVCITIAGWVGRVIGEDDNLDSSEMAKIS